MKVLVAIANFGSGNQEYLEQLLASYRKMPVKLSLVVMSNIAKNLGADVEVQIGLPISNPRSLPFAHRTLFNERIDDYDVFIYSEDDTLLRWTSLSAYLESLEILEDGEIAGFLRREKASTGKFFYSSCHSYFRWIPSSVRVRNGSLWAKYSNDHSALFVASRKQLRRAFESKGFSTKPHEGRFDMLCSAATDIYTSCGFERLICIDRISEFTLDHLPNKYIGKIGLPEEELNWQIEALRKIQTGELPSQEILQPETLLPGCLGSKSFREEQDPTLNQMLDARNQNILVWGAGDGYFESHLLREGHRVTVFPLNAVMGECCRHRGLKVLPIKEASLPINGEPFDAILLRDILHLVEQPEIMLENVRSILRSGGRVIVRVPNFHELRMIKNRIMNKLFKGSWNRERIGATPFTEKSLKNLVAGSGFGSVELKTKVQERFHEVNRITLGLFSQTLSPNIYLRAKKI